MADATTYSAEQRQRECPHGLPFTSEIHCPKCGCIHKKLGPSETQSNKPIATIESCQTLFDHLGFPNSEWEKDWHSIPPGQRLSAPVAFNEVKKEFEKKYVLAGNKQTTYNLQTSVDNLYKTDKKDKTKFVPKPTYNKWSVALGIHHLARQVSERRPSVSTCHESTHLPQRSNCRARVLPTGFPKAPSGQGKRGMAQGSATSVPSGRGRARRTGGSSVRLVACTRACPACPSGSRRGRLPALCNSSPDTRGAQPSHLQS